MVAFLALQPGAAAHSLTVEERPLGPVVQRSVGVSDEQAMCLALLVWRSSRLRQAAGPAMGQTFRGACICTYPATVMGEGGGVPHCDT